MQFAEQALAAGQGTLTDRQGAVLESALGLLVEGGEKALTTAGVARAANCSKESLYKWFGDRDGLLSAMIGYQASKVRILDVDAARLTRETLKGHLTVFARDLLEVLAGDVSLALNRLAIGQENRGRAGRSETRRRSGPALGSLLQERGRRQIGKRAGVLLDAGRKAGLLSFEDGSEAYSDFYGLIVSDLHLRWLLGEEPGDGGQAFARRAERAVSAFLRLYGTKT